MAFIAQSRRNNLWFGTEQAFGWFPTPLRGADVSPQGWNDGGLLLNGGGYQLNSFGSHKNYIFEWPSVSSREVAQRMKSYADGTYGRGLIYFVDPLIYNTNVLPAMWADPSMGLGYEGASLVYNVDPVSLPTSGWQINNLPVNSAYYDLGGIASGWRGKEEAVFIPIPEGHYLALGAIYASTGTGGVFCRLQNSSGALGATATLPGIAANATTIHNVTLAQGSHTSGVWVYVGKSAAGSASVTLSALSARVIDLTRFKPSDVEGPWIGGQGHSGCRFVGKPTYMNNTGVDGGQVSFAASFREVGSWVYG